MVPDGRYISYRLFRNEDASPEIWILPLFGERKPFRVAAAAANTFGGWFSPDAHWLSYMSYETGRSEVYVIPFPGQGGKYQISHAGGWSGIWSKRNQLFFLSTGNQVMEADLSLSAQSLQVKAIRPLFQVNLLDIDDPLFTVSADGQRFLAVTPARAESGSISLLLNWPALAKH